jgi:putative endopeptidase
LKVIPALAFALAIVLPLSAGAVDRGALDPKISPCDDFYQYACGGWLATHPIPADYPSWGRSGELGEKNLAVLRAILEKAAVDDPKRTPVQREIGDFYAACMDEGGIETRGIAAFKPDLDRIAGLDDRTGLPDIIARLHSLQSGALFFFYASQDAKDSTRKIAVVDQGGLGLPDRDFYLRDDPSSVDLRKAYVEFIRKTFVLMGEPSETAAADARAILDFESGLAKASLDNVSRRDPKNINHKLTLKELQALTPGFSWEHYFEGIGLEGIGLEGIGLEGIGLTGVSTPAVATLNVAVPDYFRALDAQLARTDLPTLRSYLRWQIGRGFWQSLPKAFVDAGFDFYGKALSGEKELPARWKICVNWTDGSLGEALGQEYVAQTLGKDGKPRILTLVQTLEAAMKKDIEALPWMTQVTRQAAIAKLEAIDNRLGYPDHWIDYSSLRIDRHDTLGNAERANEFDFQRMVRKIGRPVDRTEWSMSPPTVNAYYSSSLNSINFPAGILQPPYFDPAADDAGNLGAIGAIIGHELTHGFDDQGRQFDAHGNLRDWWTAEDGKEFERRASCVADQYSGYAVGDIKLNGRLTLGENVADLGGLRIAYLALAEAPRSQPGAAVDGFTPEQRFFLSFAQSRCENTTPEMARLVVLTDTHAPDRYRVNGVVSNLPEFQQAFQCKAGAPMAPATRCRVW